MVWIKKEFSFQKKKRIHWKFKKNQIFYPTVEKFYFDFIYELKFIENILSTKVSLPFMIAN